MVEEKSKVERQRLAWMILLGSFFACMVVTGPTLTNVNDFRAVLIT